MGKSVPIAIIWIGLAILLITLLTSSTGAASNANSGALVGIVFVLAAAATISTMAIAVSGNSGNKRQDESHFAKAKRLGRSRVDSLLEDLSDDEVYDLQRRLLAREEDEEVTYRQRR